MLKIGPLNMPQLIIPGGLHTITYYYILLQSITYYNILLHTITTVRQDSAKDTHTSMMGWYKGIQGYGSIN